MGMDNLMLSCIRALAENRIQDAKQAAIACCVNDTTKKNAGKTAKNLNQVFDYCKGEKCVLMLDEIDCIGLARGHDHGVDGELGRTTIALMQSLDSLVDGQVVIAATNRRDRLDPALLRRFQRQEEFLPFEYEERKAMIQAYMQSVNPDFLTDEILGYANDAHTQSDITKYLIEQIVSRVTAEVTGAV